MRIGIFKTILYLDRDNIHYACDYDEDKIRVNVFALYEENQELKKQLENLLNENKTLRNKLENCMTFEDYNYTLSEKVKLKNQQKEFIEYMKNEINKWHYNYDSYNYEYEIEEPTAEELLQTTLSKYKKIIGVKDER